MRRQVLETPASVLVVDLTMRVKVAERMPGLT